MTGRVRLDIKKKLGDVIAARIYSGTVGKLVINILQARVVFQHSSRCDMEAVELYHASSMFASQITSQPSSLTSHLLPSWVASSVETQGAVAVRTPRLLAYSRVPARIASASNPLPSCSHPQLRPYHPQRSQTRDYVPSSPSLRDGREYLDSQEVW